MLVVGEFVHHVGTNHKDVLQMGVGGDQASRLCQSSWKGSASAADIPSAGIDTTEFELGDNGSCRRNVIRAVGAHNHQIDILWSQTSVSNRRFACFCCQVRSSPVIRSIKTGIDTTARFELAHNFCQFWAHLAHPLGKGFIGNFIFGNVHPGS